MTVGMRREGSEMSSVRLGALAALAAVLGIVLVGAEGARLAKSASPAAAAAKAGATPAAVLPSRVADAIARGRNLLDAAATAVDTHDSSRAAAALNALPAAITRADVAARKQMSPDAAPASGPDAVVAVLTFDQAAVTRLAGLFDGQSGPLLDGATHGLFAAMNTRDNLLADVIALPDGADYAAGMAGTVTGYDDEVANIAEALSDDTLSSGGVKVLQSALAQSSKTRAAVAAAFGGGG
jgi:hypothetical protein